MIRPCDTFINIKKKKKKKLIKNKLGVVTLPSLEIWRNNTPFQTVMEKIITSLKV